MNPTALNLIKTSWAAVALALVASLTSLNALANSPLVAFNQAEPLSQYSQTQSGSYRWILGEVKKVGGQYQGDEEQRLQGDWQRRVFELGKEVSPLEAHAFMVNQLGGETRFSCTGYDCGSSNIWAAHIFKVSQLYGQETQQHYSTGLVSLAGDDQVWAVYTVRRGNKRVYQLVDQVSLANAKADLVASLSSGNKVSQSLRALSEQNAQGLVSLLNQKPGVALVVTGRVGKQGLTLDENQMMADEGAQAIAEQLIQAGVAETRIFVFGLPDVPGVEQLELFLWP